MARKDVSEILLGVRTEPVLLFRKHPEFWEQFHAARELKVEQLTDEPPSYDPYEERYAELKDGWYAVVVWNDQYHAWQPAWPPDTDPEEELNTVAYLDWHVEHLALPPGMVSLSKMDPQFIINLNDDERE